MTPHRARLVLLAAVLAAALAVPATGGIATAGSSAKIAPRVLRDTADGRTGKFLVVLSSKADVSGAAALTSKVAKGRFVYQTLSAHASRTQAPIKRLLDRMGASYRSHWVVNMLAVTGNRAVVDALAGRTDVALIEPNVRVRSSLLPKVAPIAAGPASPGTIEWNVSRVRAPQVWAMGFRGEGIVIGNVDTGQQWDHPALKEHYRGWNGVSADHNYNWFDPNQGSPVPVDPNGHGTHTVGTAIGDDGGSNQIGVAPGAQWIACRAMDAGGLGDPSTYGGCIEWMIAPTDLNGENPDPSKAPVAFSNSWYCSISLGECPNNSVLLEPVQNARAAGINVVVSAGNSGPSCRTVGNDGPPAQYDESYSVGSSNISNALSFFSSRGPASFQGERIKPDIVAPGEGVRSSYPTNTYVTLSGTSMASPHIAGVIALLYDAKPQLIGNVDQTERLLNRTATHVNSSECESNGSFPNNLWGWGFVNVERAVRR
jgi:serine protease AprX